MARWLLRGQPPASVLDGCDPKADRRWHLLRAAVPVGGRSLTILDLVFPDGQHGSPAAEKQFLQRLATLIPEGVQPILVTRKNSQERALDDERLQPMVESTPGRPAASAGGHCGQVFANESNQPCQL